MFPKPRWADDVDRNTPGIIKQETGSVRYGDFRVSTYGWVVDWTSGSGSGGGGRGSDNKGPVATYSKAKLDDCLFEVFGGRIGDLSYSYNSSGGQFSFELAWPSSGTVVPGIGRLAATTLYRYDSNELGRRLGRSTESGATFGGNKKSNYIASDVAARITDFSTDIGFRALFIHEMGNMIANILNLDGWSTGHLSENGGVNDPDIGQTLENCIFGGRVGLRTGRIGTKREL